MTGLNKVYRYYVITYERGIPLLIERTNKKPRSKEVFDIAKAILKTIKE